MPTVPSLQRRDGHSSIHEAALHEAVEIMQVYEQCMQREDMDKAYRVADIFVEHWETRTLAHARMEEEHLYPEVLQRHPDKTRTITRLERDHALMKQIVEKMKQRLMTSTADQSLLQLMGALIVIDEIHNEEEMYILPDHDHA